MGPLDAEMTPEAEEADPDRQRVWSGGGREELAVALRRLMTMAITSAAPPPVLHDVCERVAALADELQGHVPAPDALPPGRFPASSSGPAVGTMAAWMPFDVVIGSCNPVAPPISLEFDPPMAIGSATFGPLYEGAPGCVHGAALAGAFDLMLAAACVVANVAGPTAELAIRFRKPTLIGRPLVIETWVTKTVGRRVHSEGRLIQDGLVTVEAVGQFVDIGRDRVASMHRRSDGRSPGHASNRDDVS